MITFRYKVNPKQKRKDGTMNVKIIVTYKRQRKMLPTSIYCTKDDITKGGKIKNQIYLDQLERILREYRTKASTLGLEFQDVPLEAIVKSLKNEEDIDFFKFAAEFIPTIKVEGTRKMYKIATNRVRDYVGGVLPFKLMTKNFFMGFEKFLTDRHNAYTVGDSQLITTVRAIYRQAQKRYNTEGKEMISSFPLTAYKPRKVSTERKRALPIEKIREMMKLDIKDGRDALARDLFILSFSLMGMNLIDMYNADYVCEDKVCYCRSKTKRWRHDKAYLEVDIDPRIKPLVEKYRGGKKMFNLSERFKWTTLPTYLTRGIHSVGEMIGVPDLTFYSARHSFATIAYNDCGIDKYVVHTALNHVAQEMKITDVYIRRTFEKENEANRKVLDLLFQEDGEGR